MRRQKQDETELIASYGVRYGFYSSGFGSSKCVYSSRFLSDPKVSPQQQGLGGFLSDPVGYVYSSGFLSDPVGYVYSSGFLSDPVGSVYSSGFLSDPTVSCLQ